MTIKKNKKSIKKKVVVKKNTQRKVKKNNKKRKKSKKKKMKGGHDEYSEYKKDTTQYDNESNFNICMNNIKNHANAKQAPYMHNNKLTIIRDMSDNAIPKLEDNFFDIIYIDGNHKTEFVYNDATNVLSKLKNGGILIFDDSSWKDVSVGIDKFINENSDKIVHIGKVRDNEQAIYRKL